MKNLLVICLALISFCCYANTYHINDRFNLAINEKWYINIKESELKIVKTYPIYGKFNYFEIGTNNNANNYWYILDNNNVLKYKGGLLESPMDLYNDKYLTIKLENPGQSDSVEILISDLESGIIILHNNARIRRNEKITNQTIKSNQIYYQKVFKISDDLPDNKNRDLIVNKITYSHFYFDLIKQKEFDTGVKDVIKWKHND